MRPFSPLVIAFSILCYAILSHKSCRSRNAPQCQTLWNANYANKHANRQKLRKCAKSIDVHVQHVVVVAIRTLSTRPGVGRNALASTKFNVHKARRKEYRMLSEAERDRFHAALWTMKRNGTFDKLFGAAHARYAEGTGAHFGPAFLPWHREFIKRFEFELRMIDPELALPYWDTALDARLANPRDSILFSDELMGNVDSWGQVSSGIFRGWESINWEKLLAGTDLTREYGWANVEYFHDFLDEKRYTVSINIRRNMSDMRIPLMGDEHIAAIVLQPYGSALFGQNNLQNARCPYRNIQTLETFHRYAHMFIGGETGDMNESIRAANDPIFYLLHSFIDLLWELWREKYQSRVQQSTVYPTDLPPSCALVEHSLNLTMHPFEGFTNRDGLSTLYTDNLYFYDWRPSCSYERPFCDSRFCSAISPMGSPSVCRKCAEGPIVWAILTTKKCAMSQFALRDVVSCRPNICQCNAWIGAPVNVLPTTTIAMCDVFVRVNASRWLVKRYIRF